ncbi:serine hydrolase FSH [Aspergillus aurantiobrunneus]
MPPLPRIACFHGGGSNSTIFELQCSFLSSLLADTFVLEFFDGPFTRPAGPGVLPAFDGYAPYFSWFRPGTDAQLSNGNGAGYDDTGRDGIDRVLGLMRARAKEKGFGMEMWVGALGFSQGTRVVGGLLLDQQRRAAVGERAGAGEGVELRFGVLCNGGGAPMESKAALGLDQPDTVVRIPTLHLHGLKDEFLVFGRDQLAKFYDPETAKLYEINYHHAMPWVKAESEELARLFKELYNKTRA